MLLPSVHNSKTDLGLVCQRFERPRPVRIVIAECNSQGCSGPTADVTSVHVSYLDQSEEGILAAFKFY